MCNFVKTWRLKMFLFALAIAALAPAANAAPIPMVSIKLSESGFASVICNSAPDSTSCLQPYGTFRVVNPSGDTTLASPGILFSDGITTSRTAGVLTILVTATNLTGLEGFMSAFTNNMPTGRFNSVVESTFWDPANAPFALTDPLGTHTFTTIGTASQTTLSGPLPPLFSVTEKYVITMSGSGSNDSTIVVDVVPEPSSLALLGGGLLLMGSLVRRFRLR